MIAALSTLAVDLSREGTPQPGIANINNRHSDRRPDFPMFPM
jgi:hypothetical protein